MRVVCRRAAGEGVEQDEQGAQVYQHVGGVEDREVDEAELEEIGHPPQEQAFPDVAGRPADQKPGADALAQGKRVAGALAPDQPDHHRRQDRHRQDGHEPAVAVPQPEGGAGIGREIESQDARDERTRLSGVEAGQRPGFADNVQRQAQCSHRRQYPLHLSPAWWPFSGAFSFASAEAVAASSSMAGTTFRRLVRKAIPIRELRAELVTPMVAISSSLRFLALAGMTRSSEAPSRGRQASVGFGCGYCSGWLVIDPTAISPGGSASSSFAEYWRPDFTCSGAVNIAGICLARPKETRTFSKSMRSPMIRQFGPSFFK